MGDLFLFAPSDLVRNNSPVSAGGRNAPGPATAAVRRKWVVRDRGWPTPPPDAEGEAADTFHRPQALDGRLTQKKLIAGQQMQRNCQRSGPVATVVSRATSCRSSVLFMSPMTMRSRR